MIVALPERMLKTTPEQLLQRLRRISETMPDRGRQIFVARIAGFIFIEFADGERGNDVCLAHRLDACPVEAFDEENVLPQPLRERHVGGIETDLTGKPHRHELCFDDVVEIAAGREFRD